MVANTSPRTQSLPKRQRPVPGPALILGPYGRPIGPLGMDQSLDLLFQAQLLFLELGDF